MRNFKELEIWTLGMQIVKSVYSIATDLPAHERFGLTSQITRAAVSIPSNIAEGCAKSEKEFRLYLERSLGSAFELETQLLVIAALKLSQGDIDALITLVQREQKMLGAFISSVKKRLAESRA